MVTDRPARIVAFSALAFALAASLIGAPLPTAIARAFFVVTVLAGLVAGAGLVGPRTQVGAALTALILVVGQTLPLSRSVADPPSPDWRRELESADDRAEVRMRLDAPGWRAALAGAADAWAYVCAEGVGASDSALTLRIQTDRDAWETTIGAGDAIGARPRPEQGGMFRTAVPLSFLRGASEANFEVARTANAGVVRICGTHTIRPSWGEPTSLLVRGGVSVAPSPKGPGRWVIELRLTDAQGRLLISWY